MGKWVNVGNPEGSVAPGDLVSCGGDEVRVQRVVIHPPQAHVGSPIRDDWHAVEIITAAGSRWTGAPSAHIGADLRVHWAR